MSASLQDSETVVPLAACASGVEGAAGSCGTVPPSWMLSNVAVLMAAVVWLVTASPM